MKILEYARERYKKRPSALTWAEKVIYEYKENVWHNEPEKPYYKDYIIFSYRTIQIHNANGYQGFIKQFLWRANMDYHQLLTSEQPMQQQPAPTDYAAQLAAVKTLPELFDFRAKPKSFLKAEIEDYFGDMTCKKTEPERVQAERISELEFFISRAESQIKALENSGVFLAAVDGRGAVYGLDFSSGQSTQVETLVENSAGIIAEAALSPIEEIAKDLGFIDALRMMQNSVNESEWGCLGQNSLLHPLYVANLIVRVDIFGENIYLWRHDMDYINFLVKNPPKN